MRCAESPCKVLCPPYPHSSKAVYLENVHLFFPLSTDIFISLTSPKLLDFYEIILRF